ncbi:MAG: hypothetical protein ABI602_03140 [Candidatus Saccharibacteria bacterium]
MPFEVSAIIDNPGPDQRAAAHTDGQEIQAVYNLVAARAGAIVAEHTLQFKQTTHGGDSERHYSTLHLVAEYPLTAPDPSFEVISIVGGSGPDLLALAEKGRLEIEAAYRHVAAAAGTIVAVHSRLPRTRQNNRSVLYLVAEYPLTRLTALPDPPA